MRIVPVTGDLPAIVMPPPPPVRHVADPPPPPATAPVEHAARSGTSADAATDHRHPPGPKSCFDPPLIAQRAVLGLPTGYLIADLARSRGIPHAAASAAVDRELPRPVD